MPAIAILLMLKLFLQTSINPEADALLAKVISCYQHQKIALSSITMVKNVYMACAADHDVILCFKFRLVCIHGEENQYWNIKVPDIMQ